ncbi:DUF6368 family protein [Winogradskya humida]|uniref:Uncharacterized protein n=1 Tax=Winogradskya humida TaxID=113566 RepID=A0ABQ3ZIS4_9ACTN|nr:DUF6368 family protein [Actinoplanes humidus]GIE18398.1 hypothetical protein Ahu01nite_015000 [Actinoplanes humidus]
MAGPTAAVLTPDPFTAGNLNEFHGWLAESLTPDTAGNSWLLREPRRLGMESPVQTGPMLIEPIAYEDEDAEEAACMERALGFPPGSEVVLAAAVNGKDDHRFLAHLAVAIARRYGGLIDLGGRLPVPPPRGVPALAALESGVGLQEWQDLSRATIATLAGRRHEIPYRTAGGEVAMFHVVDADLLTSWLRHPLFRMVK